MYRAVFVKDRMEEPEVPGPDNEGAAIIMGNTPRQWDMVYWKDKRQVLANKAVQKLSAYREAKMR
jgi:hypothetical protein